MDSHSLLLPVSWAVPRGNGAGENPWLVVSGVLHLKALCAINGICVPFAPIKPWLLEALPVAALGNLVYLMCVGSAAICVDESE